MPVLHSLSLASRFTPVTAAVAAVLLLGRGVSGGVVMGTPVTFPELVAAMLGTLPPIKVGFVMTAADACVVTDDVLFDRAGEDGLMLTKEAVVGGDCAANELAEFRCW